MEVSRVRNSKAFEPGELVAREVGKAAHAHGLRHQTQVLEDHALLDHDHGVQQGLDAFDGQRAAVVGVVPQVPASALAEPGDARGAKARAFVHDEHAHGVVQELKQAVDVHVRVLVDRHEIGGARLIQVPLVAIQVVGGTREAPGAGRTAARGYADTAPVRAPRRARSTTRGTRSE